MVPQGVWYSPANQSINLHFHLQLAGFPNVPPSPCKATQPNLVTAPAKWPKWRDPPQHQASKSPLEVDGACVCPIPVKDPSSLFYGAPLLPNWQNPKQVGKTKIYKSGNKSQSATHINENIHQLSHIMEYIFNHISPNKTQILSQISYWEHLDHWWKRVDYHMRVYQQSYKDGYKWKDKILTL